MHKFRNIVMTVGMLLLLSVMPLAAQVANRVVFTAPFPFYTGNVKLPAGSYIITEPDVGDTRRRVVELIDVTFIDRRGEHVLSEIMSVGAEFIASDVYTTHLLNNLRSALKGKSSGKEQM